MLATACVFFFFFFYKTLPITTRETWSLMFFNWFRILLRILTYRIYVHPDICQGFRLLYGSFFSWTSWLCHNVYGGQATQQLVVNTNNRVVEGQPCISGSTYAILRDINSFYLFTYLFIYYKLFKLELLQCWMTIKHPYRLAHISKHTLVQVSIQYSVPTLMWPSFGAFNRNKTPNNNSHIDTCRGL